MDIRQSSVAAPDGMRMARSRIPLMQTSAVQRLNKLLSCRLAMLQLLQHLAQDVRKDLCCAAPVLHLLHASRDGLDSPSLRATYPDLKTAPERGATGHKCVR